MTLFQKVHYVWVRAGLALLVLSPIAMFLMFRAQNLPDGTFEPTQAVNVVETDETIRFEPVQTEAAAGWILIPGCPADPRAYGPLARAVAMRSFTSVIVKVPFRCAPWPQHAAELRRRVSALITGRPTCRWVVAGHSRGARHALELIRLMPEDRVAALILMGSTHPREEDFSGLSLPVLKISASEDGVAPLATSIENRALLPPETRFETVDGGNHAQFAYYGFQLFDRRARISRETQHARVVDLIVNVLASAR